MPRTKTVAPEVVEHHAEKPLGSSQTSADAAETAPPQPPPAETVEARPGDTPLKLLARVGVTPEDAQEAARLLARVWDPRDLRPGQRAAVLTQSDRLLSFRLALAPDRDIVVARDHTGGFVVEDQDRPTREVPTLGSGTIHTSLAAAADRAGVPSGVLAEMIRAFSYDVDFAARNSSRRHVYRTVRPDRGRIRPSDAARADGLRRDGARRPFDPAVPLYAERR